MHEFSIAMSMVEMAQEEARARYWMRSCSSWGRGGRRFAALRRFNTCQ
jgi:hypothetical protein